MKHKLAVGIFALLSVSVAALLVLTVVSFVNDDEPVEPRPVAATTPAVDYPVVTFTTISTSTSTSTSTTPRPPRTIVTEGVYLVGEDMEPGVYKSPGEPGIRCYWSRAKDDAGSNLIANDSSEGPQRFTAKVGEFVSIRRCTFTKTG